MVSTGSSTATSAAGVLSLELDDAELPLPYVIDPAVDYPSPLYLSSTASTVTNSWRLVGASPTPQNIVTDTVPAQNATGYYQFRPGQTTNTASTPSTTPTGRGWALDTAGGTGFPAGSWDFTIQVDIPGTPFTAGSAHLVAGVWKGTISGGAFTLDWRAPRPLHRRSRGQLRAQARIDQRRHRDGLLLAAAVHARGKRAPLRRALASPDRRDQRRQASRRQLDLLVNNGTARIVHPAADDAGPTGSLTSPGAVIRGYCDGHRERRGHGLRRRERPLRGRAGRLGDLDARRPVRTPRRRTRSASTRRRHPTGSTTSAPP